MVTNASVQAVHLNSTAWCFRYTDASDGHIWCFFLDIGMVDNGRKSNNNLSHYNDPFWSNRHDTGIKTIRSFCFLISGLNTTPWWRHQMKTVSTLLAICAGNSPVTLEFPTQNQWRGALMFPLICVWINGWVNNGESGDLRRHGAHYDVIVMHSETNVERVPLLPLVSNDLSIMLLSMECFRDVLSMACSSPILVHHPPPPPPPPPHTHTLPSEYTKTLFNVKD